MWDVFSLCFSFFSFSESIVSLLPAKILSRTHSENIYSSHGSRNTPFSDSTMNHYNTELGWLHFVMMLFIILKYLGALGWFNE